MDNDGTVAAQLAAPDTILTMWRKVAAYHEIPLDKFSVFTNRQQHIVRARREAFAMICAVHKHKSISYIAYILNCDHTTVLYAVCRTAGMPAYKDERSMGRWRGLFMRQRAEWRRAYRRLCEELGQREMVRRQEEQRLREIEERTLRLQALYRNADRVAAQLRRTA